MLLVNSIIASATGTGFPLDPICTDDSELENNLRKNAGF